MKPVVFSEVIARLRACPVCFAELSPPLPAENLIAEKICDNGCGKFFISAVNMDGSVDIVFRMASW